ncbi:MAG: hypothetical protein GY869_04535 [Planctomycetes bacterium]|nr:hypothetical protein [Planctomycetota bacterium]
MALLIVSIAGCQSSPSNQIWRTRSSSVSSASTPWKVINDISGPAVDVSGNFENATPIQPKLDMQRIVKAQRYTGGYRVVPGDVLEFRMPSIMRSVNPELAYVPGPVEPYTCRVSPAGAIILPIIGAIVVTGRNMGEIETLIVNSYYPKYVHQPPSAVGRVFEYRTAHLTITGAVNEPGVHECHSDELSLVNLIMKAKGIVNEGAAAIRIYRNGNTSTIEPLLLPVKGLNIPFADVALNDGDMVEVEQLNPQVFTVIGLVNQSGVFPYPPGTKYNLMQALAFAGGVNEVAAPKYARIYRQRDDGSIISASFRLKGTRITDAPSTVVKPGDIVAVEQTFSTQTRLFLAQLFRITAGVTYRLDSLYNDDIY